MATARDIIKSALRKIHVLGTGSTLSNEDAADGLESLNDMLSIWSIEGNLIYTDTAEQFSLVSGTGSYTIAAAGDFATTRPTEITSAYVSQGNTDYILEWYSQEQYNAISDKTTQGTPSIYYYDGNFPTGTIYLSNVPNGIDSITISSSKVLTQFDDLDGVFAMPPEYLAALKFNLAEWLAPEYEREPSMQVKSIANTTKEAVRAQNTKNEKYVSEIDMPASENDYYYEDITRGNR